MRKIYLVFASLFICVSMFATTKNGELGNNFTWQFEGGTLTISGQGEMADFDTYTCPWSKQNTSAPLKNEDIKKMVISEGVTSIGKYMCYDCGSLTEVQLPNSLTALGEQCFERCTSLTSIQLPDAVEKIGDGAFSDCTSLSNVKFSKQLKTIGDKAFASDDNDMALTSVNLSETQLETIGSGTFSFNVNLEIVHLPKTFKGFYSINFMGSKIFGESAFQGCSNIKKVICDAPTAPETDPEASYNFPFGSSKLDAELIVPAGSESSYQAAGWTEHFKTITTTGIQSVTRNTAYQFFDVYTLSGAKYMNHKTAKEISTLPKGLYIVNGHKFLVR